MPSKKTGREEADRAVRRMREEDNLRREARSRELQDEMNERSERQGLPSAGLPITVRSGGEYDPYETGRIIGNNYVYAAKKKAERDDADIRRMADAESYRDEAYAKGGMVNKKKSPSSGSVRGGGVALRGVGKGTVY